MAAPGVALVLRTATMIRAPAMMPARRLRLNSTGGATAKYSKRATPLSVVKSSCFPPKLWSVRRLKEVPIRLRLLFLRPRFQFVGKGAAFSSMIQRSVACTAVPPLLWSTASRVTSSESLNMMPLMTVA